MANPVLPEPARDVPANAAASPRPNVSLSAAIEFARAIDSARRSGESCGDGARASADRIDDMTMPHSDKRKETRAAAAVPLFFKNGRGVTDDVAATGVFFWTDSAADFAVGDHIDFTVVISDSGTTATSECSGEVVRVLRRHTPKGVAVKLFHPALKRFVS
jgi:hypothetical protein